MHSLSVFGTSSDAGKSTLAFALTYLLHQRGLKVAPFKAQNVSNNAVACDSGGEIAQPQHFAAEAIGLQTTPDFNPVLLKSGRGSSAALIVNGEAVKEQDVRAYYADLDSLKPVVKSAFQRLQTEFDVIVAEGAGSPVELNLMDKDLSNIYVATEFNTKIVLVADIERGGVFASVWGVYNLLPEALKANVVGVIVNKFRGDITLFDEGVKIIEERFGIPVLGVVPYRPFNLGFEDIQSLLGYTQYKPSPRVRAAVVQLPHISNFNDFEPLVLDPEVEVSFVSTPAGAAGCDLLIIPGTKRTVNDLQWLREQGFERLLERFEGIVVAICGGYEMMFERICDPEGIEAEAGCVVKGLGRIAGEVTFVKQKRVCRGSYELFGVCAEGYEIHHGKAEHFAVEIPQFYGTFMHGLFDSDAFRKLLFVQIDEAYEGYDFGAAKRASIEEFAAHVASVVDTDAVIKALQED